MAELKKTVAQLKKEYDALAEQCAAIAADVPKLRRKIEAEVIARIGEEQKKFADLKERKRQAFIAWQEAQAAPVEPEPVKADPPRPIPTRGKA